MQQTLSARRRWHRSAAAALAVVPIFIAACEETPGEAAQHAHDTPPPAVTVAMVREQEVNESFEFVGHAEARQTVDLRARVQGFLQERRFEEGEDVRTR
jgi:membrane fusion protein (multidrug efflux system)